MIDRYMAQADELKAQWKKLHDEDPIKHAVEMERLSIAIASWLSEVAKVGDIYDGPYL
jgi:hypothetical protein